MESESSRESQVEFPSTYLVFWDYIVLALFFLISMGIGIYQAYVGSKRKSTQEFLVANGAMSVIPVAVSQMVTLVSPNLLINFPVIIAVYGTQSTMWIFGYSGGVVVAAILFTPVLYRLNIVNVYEYMERRFHKSLKVYTSILYILLTEFNLAVYLYIPAISMNIVTGVNEWIAVGCIAVVSIVYTSIGGMKAVLWTDLFQAILMALGVLSIFISGLVNFGGLGEMWSLYSKHDRVEFFNLDPDPRVKTSLWGIVFGSMCLAVINFSVYQSTTQRSLCTPTLRKAQISLLLTIPIFFTFLLSCTLAGLVIFAKYHSCDPSKLNIISREEGLVPLYVMENMRFPGIPGFFFAAIFSGALSSISSALNSLSAIIYKDVLCIPCGRYRAEEKEFYFLKIITLISGIFMILATVLVSKLGFLFEFSISNMSIIGGPLLGVYILGLFFPWSNYKGALAGLTVGLFVNYWISICKMIYRPPVFGHVPPPMNTTQCGSMYARNASIHTLLNHPSNLTSLLSNSQTFGDDTVSLLSENISYQALSENFTYAMFNSTGAGQERFAISSFHSFLMPLYSISFWWYPLIGVFISVFTGIVISFMTGATSPKDVDPALLSPILSFISKLLPHKYALRKQVQKNPEEKLIEVNNQSI